MPTPKPAPRPRQMGGFNPGMGDSNEHLDESAMQAAVQQKGMQQQAADPGTSPLSGVSGPGSQQSGLGSALSGGGGPSQGERQEKVVWNEVPICNTTTRYVHPGSMLL